MSGHGRPEYYYSLAKTTGEEHVDERSSMLGHGHSHLPANLGEQDSLKVLSKKDLFLVI
jgi:hypothetical protein